MSGARGEIETDLAVMALAACSGLTCLLLASFYLYTPVISSRYTMGFAPAFAAAALAAWLFIVSRCRPRWMRVLAVAVLCGWVGMEFSLARSVYGAPLSVTWTDLESRSLDPSPYFGAAVARSHQTWKDRSYLNAFDGVGWQQDTGALKPLVIVFVHSPKYLELELETRPCAGIRPDPEDIRAKVGLEYLQQERIEKTERGWRLRYAGPKQQRYQAGFQAAFIATVPKAFLAEEETPWVLRSVRWREEGDPPRW